MRMCSALATVGCEPPLNWGTLLKVLSHGQNDPGPATRQPGKFGSIHFATWYSMVCVISTGWMTFRLKRR